MAAIAAYNDFWDLAACRSADPDIFFPVSDAGPGQAEIVKAKAVCAGCQVRAQCLEYALSTRQVHGVWGGTSETERRLMAAARERVTRPAVSWRSRARTARPAAAPVSTSKARL